MESFENEKGEDMKTFSVRDDSGDFRQEIDELRAHMERTAPGWAETPSRSTALRQAVRNEILRYGRGSVHPGGEDFALQATVMGRAVRQEANELILAAAKIGLDELALTLYQHGAAAALARSRYALRIAMGDTVKDPQDSVPRVDVAIAADRAAWQAEVDQAAERLADELSGTLSLPRENIVNMMHLGAEAVAEYLATAEIPPHPELAALATTPKSAN